MSIVPSTGRTKISIILLIVEKSMVSSRNICEATLKPPPSAVPSRKLPTLAPFPSGLSISGALMFAPEMIFTLLPASRLMFIPLMDISALGASILIPLKAFKVMVPSDDLIFTSRLWVHNSISLML